MATRVDGRLDLDLAGVPAIAVADGRSVVVTTPRPVDLVAELLHVRRLVRARPRWRDLPLTVELHDHHHRPVFALRARPGRRPAVRFRPLPVLRGWWRSRTARDRT